MKVGWGLDRILYLGKAKELMIVELNKEEKSERGKRLLSILLLLYLK